MREATSAKRGSRDAQRPTVTANYLRLQTRTRFRCFLVFCSSLVSCLSFSLSVASFLLGLPSRPFSTPWQERQKGPSFLVAYRDGGRRPESGSILAGKARKLGASRWQKWQQISAGLVWKVKEGTEPWSPGDQKEQGKTGHCKKSLILWDQLRL